MHILKSAPEAKRIEIKIDSALSEWVVEQMPGGSVTAQDGVLEIRDKAGCTVWLRTALQAPVEISYEVMVVGPDDSGGRVSDMNCFWMATDPGAGGDFFSPSRKRTGEFSTYDHLATYYVGYGGNSNTTTRFRRYGGDGTRPLLPENDLQKPEYLLQANHWYHLKLVARDGRAEFIRDGQSIFRFEDHRFLDRGWFGIRTVDSVLRIRHVIVNSGMP